MKIFLNAGRIDRIVGRIAREINKDYQDKDVVLIGILKGSMVFISDLMRKLNVPVEVDFMEVSSYEGTESTGKTQIKKDISVDIANRHVLIVEDSINTGLTLATLKNILLERKPASLKVVALLDKPSERKVELTPDYKGTTLPDIFVVGYGLDYNGHYRNFPEIRILSKETKNI